MAGRPPQTTLVPFDELPDCASQCGPLYDADGACAPFAGQRLNQDAWDRCFCAFGSLQPWTTGISRVCDGACAEPTDLLSIRDWFSSECEEIVQFQTLGPLTTSTVPPGVTTVTVTPTARPVSGGSQAATGNGGGGDWLSTHWRWVIMLIVLTVGIAGIWIGACIWRRRYLKRKEQDPHRRTSGNLRGTGPGGGASWGPSGSAAMPRSYGDGVVDGRSNSRRVPPSSGPLATAATGPNGHGHGRNGNAVGNGKMPMSMVQSGNQPAGAFMPGAAAKAMDGRSGSKRGSKEQRKWIVKERT